MTDNADALLRGSVTGDGGARRVTLPAGLQGFPDTAHGGSVLALFDTVASASGPRTLSGVYRRRVPLATPLSLSVERDGATTRLSLSDGATALVEGSVTPSLDADAVRAPVTTGERRPLPISRTCFACGVENPIGLRAQPEIDDRSVWVRWTPTTSLRSIGTIALTTLMDEAAFWLGAAATGESGMTTELVVTLHAEPREGPLIIAGPRASVRPNTGDARYWDTETAAWEVDGRLVATARITFVAIRGAARKLVGSLFAINSADVMRTVFPTYVR
jgi:acyl-coenzyme A thioesterase PaaI-like protein